VAAQEYLEGAIPGVKVEGNAKGSPRRGAFEITSNGKVLFSKLSSGGFPSDSTMQKIASSLTTTSSSTTTTTTTGKT
jgi:selT/selW/selH-like putative selenoprotein